MANKSNKKSSWFYGKNGQIYFVAEPAKGKNKTGALHASVGFSFSKN